MPSKASDEVRVWKHPTPYRCEVGVLAEGITLIFERVGQTGIVCADRYAEHSTASKRVTNKNFVRARKLAVRTMDDLLLRERERVERAASNIIVNESTITECSLSYFGRRVTYFCPADTPLGWHTLQKIDAYDERVKSDEELPPLPDLLDSEWQEMKKRAFSRIQALRKRHGFSEEGVGFSPSPSLSPQLTFEFEKT